MITLHHLEYSQSFRILWLLEELGAEYELKLYNRDPETRLAPDEYKAISPLGTAPVITEGEFTLAESNAIIDYILDSHHESDMRPGPGHPDRARNLFWFHAAQGSLMSVQFIEIALTSIEMNVPFFLKGLFRSVFNRVRSLLIKPRLKRLFDLMEKDLGQKPWFAGDALGTSDITLSYPMLAAHNLGLFEGTYPNIVAWIEHIQARPAWKAAREKDGRDSVIFTFD
ncbi:glutathione S-transferase family protein [Altererythrobacter sp. MF3-039]|uniref:glutathione S-transferase family protein n=1 Tax=Altererythrobacter sp. MF3-039 TaxID=3252901 RepID=UPI00390C4ED6